MSIKELVCKFLDLVPAAELEQANDDIARRDLCIRQIAEASRKPGFRVMLDNETSTLEVIHGDVYIVGDDVIMDRPTANLFVLLPTAHNCAVKNPRIIGMPDWRDRAQLRGIDQ